MATFHFDLVSPAKLIFAGEVEQVDVPGLEGDFGVLAGHAPLVATLKPGVITVFGDGQPRRYVVLGGFAEVSPEGLTILADVSWPFDEADPQFIQGRIEELEEARDKLEAERKDDSERAQLDRAIEKLDHYKVLDRTLQGDLTH
ncbi:MAG TPA: F0F1 ATP synthase subunit epsilon [Xanthobacteraceae bacterium]|jgi:F-type H+-transporting ATPase subunit epsilon|nr:F0F1 ATP synthase subunit epsilon [Xanthobacteraceae bacterium]